MKAAKVLYLKKTQTHFGEAMRLNGERDGIRHACAEIAAYIDAHQAAGVYMANDKSAIMYCAGVKIVLRRVLPYLWVIVAVRFYRPHAALLAGICPQARQTRRV